MPDSTDTHEGRPPSEAPRQKRPSAPVWARTGASLLEELGTSRERGLSDARAEALRDEVGPNVLEGDARTDVWRALIQQASRPIALLSVAATGAALFADRRLDAALWLAFAGVGTALRLASQLQSERSMRGLREAASARARVRRNGEWTPVPIADLVPGDVVRVAVGDVIGADGRVLESHDLRVDETPMTEQATPVQKSSAPALSDAPLSERSSMLYRGSAVTRGHAELLVVATGASTEIGSRERAQLSSTAPFQREAGDLERWILRTAIVAGVLVALLGRPADTDVSPVYLGLALAVAVVPDALRVLFAAAARRGARRMAREHALLQNFDAIERLSETDALIVGKSSTLTLDDLSVERVVTPAGEVRLAARAPEERETESAATDPSLRELAEHLTLCADPDDISSAPLEEAVGELAGRTGLDPFELRERFPLVRRVPFDPQTMRMASLHDAGASGDLIVAVKGSAESVLAACTAVQEPEASRPLDERARRDWMRKSEQLGAEGLHVIAVAAGRVRATDADPFKEGTLLGLVALSDAAHEVVQGSIEACRNAGVRFVMATADQSLTALRVARAVGLVDDKRQTRAVLGRDLERIDDMTAAERKVCLASPVYARVTPSQRTRLVEAYRAAGRAVLLLGARASDAAAMRESHASAALGGHGSQVARRVADVVVADDDVESLVLAIEQARIVLGNVKKIASFLVLSGFSELFVIVGALMLRIPLPVLPLQLLFLKVAVDGAPVAALGWGRGDGRDLERAPRPRGTTLLGPFDGLRLGVLGLTVAGASLLAMIFAHHVLNLAPTEVRTTAFLALGIGQLVSIFSVRDPRSRPLRNDLSRNLWLWLALAIGAGLLFASVRLPALRALLETADPGTPGWIVAGVAGLTPFVAGQLMLLWSAQRERGRDEGRR